MRCIKRIKIFLIIIGYRFDNQIIHSYGREFMFKIGFGFPLTCIYLEQNLIEYRLENFGCLDLIGNLFVYLHEINHSFMHKGNMLETMQRFFIMCENKLYLIPKANVRRRENIIVEGQADIGALIDLKKLIPNIDINEFYSYVENSKLMEKKPIWDKESIAKIIKEVDINKIEEFTGYNKKGNIIDKMVNIE